MVLGNSLTAAPANLTNGTATLRFQQPDDPAASAVVLHFQTVGEVLRASATRGTPLPVPPGRLVDAIALEVAPALGGGHGAFEADVALTLAGRYVGSGADLDLLRWDGTNWTRPTFA
jgi:hypothetical protein